TRARIGRTCSGTAKVMAALAGEAERRAFLLDQALDRRAGEHVVDVALELRPALPIDVEARVAQVDELGAERDVGDREAGTRNDRRVAELAREVVEQRRQVLLDRLLHHRLVGRLIEETRLDDLLEEDLRPEDVD